MVFVGCEVMMMRVGGAGMCVMNPSKGEERGVTREGGERRRRMEREGKGGMAGGERKKERNKKKREEEEKDTEGRVA
jgi:hypothetical protein